MQKLSDPFRGATRITFVYTLFGMLWILFSDQLLLALVDRDPQRFVHFQTWKGWLFIAATAAMLFLLVRRTLARQTGAENALQTLNAELEQRVAERAAQLEAVNRELEAFSYSVSHDLKAPLRGVDGYSQILLLDHADQLDDEGRELLANVRRGVSQMQALIEDMLVYSRIERRPLDAQPLDAGTVLSAVLASVRHIIDARDVAVTCEVPSSQIVADREGFAMVWRNLVDNALKFTRGREFPKIEIGAQEDAEHIQLWIRDNGVGFDMKYHERVFEIFQRLHRAEDYPGTGVGLALVKKAVNRMGGRVWAQSAPGEGATFFMELPK